MIPATQPKIFGTGLIALDLVIGPDPETPVRSWTGGTCGNVLSILAWLGWDAYPIARMNGDVASERVRVDMARWGVHLDWTTCAPTTDTPVIVQEIRRGRMAGPGTGSPGRVRAVANGYRLSRRLRSPWWRGSGRRSPMHRCSSSIACRGQPSPWPPRRPLAAPWWCSSHPARRPTSSWRKRSHSRMSSSTLRIALPASAVSWKTAPRPCSKCIPLGSGG